VVDCEGVYGGACGPPLPDFRNRFTATWVTPWDALVTATWRHIGEVDQIQTNVPVDIDAQDYFDLAGIWNVTDFAALRAGVNNVMDEEPPITDNGSTLRNNGNTYPGVYDHLGQYWFLGVSFQF